MNQQYRIVQTDLSEHAYEAIKEMILMNALSPGEKLNQEQLADNLGVSRTPLLSAFHKLEKEMLVELIPRRGAFVKKLSPKELEDLYDVRLRLEPLGAARAAGIARKEDIDLLKGALGEFSQAVEETSIAGFRRSDHDLHNAIMQMSGNDILYRIISSFSIIMVSNLEGLNKPLATSLREHEELIQAISDHDEEKAEEVMYRHINGARLHIVEKHRSGTAD